MRTWIVFNLVKKHVGCGTTICYVITNEDQAKITIWSGFNQIVSNGNGTLILERYGGFSPKFNGAFQNNDCTVIHFDINGKTQIWSMVDTPNPSMTPTSAPTDPPRVFFI